MPTFCCIPRPECCLHKITTDLFKGKRKGERENKGERKGNREKGEKGKSPE